MVPGKDRGRSAPRAPWPGQFPDLLLAGPIGQAQQATEFDLHRQIARRKHIRTPFRELENAIHRATLICQDGRIEREDLGLGLGLRGGQDVAVDDSLATLEEIVRPFAARLLQAGHDGLLDRLIAATVREAYDRCGANQIKTAEVLGVTRNVVRTYLKNLGLI